MPRPKAEGGGRLGHGKNTPKLLYGMPKKGTLTLISKNNNKETLKHFQIYLSKIGHQVTK